MSTYTKEFLANRAIPSYLSAKSEQGDCLEATTSGRESSQGYTNADGDAAAGSVLRRVSSFNILRPSPRLPDRRTVRESLKQAKETKTAEQKVFPTWRLKDRMKTVGVGLVMALNVGTDPPDITKPHPCAKLQCWMDPTSVSRAKAKEKIGERLEAQYAKWQQQRAAKPLKYKKALDPTVEDVRALCLGLRRQARQERILLHYNGHGVPRPTANGEIWVFDKNHTQYIPLCVTDLRQWMGKPSIVVLDCSSAGILMPFLTAPLESSESTPVQTPPGSSLHLSAVENMEAAASQWVRDTIVLCPTASDEWLPMHPDYPADVFTSCLTTPIKMALRWFVRRNPQSMAGLDPEVVDAIPGKANDRKTPLGELNWIFTAVTDSIAWNILPKPLFQRLFRQDLLVASMFRNFLLADRILRSLNCSPQSYPPLPPGVCDHPLWQAWDLACETCLYGLIRDNILGNHVLAKIHPEPEGEGDEDSDTVSAKPAAEPPVTMGPASSVTSPFFSEQLTAFEIWLEFASLRKSSQLDEPLESPEQLPVVLQVLLSQAHRVRALALLRQFLDLGTWAVNLALSLGIFPYVMKLLQSPEYKQDLIGIWAKILDFDQSCQQDLVKDGSLSHFVQHLTWGLNKATMHLPLNPVEAADQRVLAAFILSLTCHRYSQGQSECMRQNLHGTCCALLSSVEPQSSVGLDQDAKARHALAEERVPARFRLWLCICLGCLVDGNRSTQAEAIASGVHLRLFTRLQDDSPDVRAAACFAISCLLSQPPLSDRSQTAQSGSDGAPGPTTAIANLSAMQGSRLVPHQSLMLPPQIVAASGEGFAGRLQPTFQPGPGEAAWQNPSGAMGIPVAQHPQSVARQIPPGTALSSTTSPVHLQSDSSASVNQGPGFRSDHPRRSSSLAFEDRRRLEDDLLMARTTLKVFEDASALVRYEGIIVLAQMLEKYFPAFLAASEEMTGFTEEANSEDDRSGPTNEVEAIDRKFPFPGSIDNETADKFRAIWKSLRDVQHRDAHSSVASAANSMVRYVHENILRAQSIIRSEENKSPLLDGSMSTSEHDLLRLSASTNEKPPDGPVTGSVSVINPRSGVDGDDHMPLRRISSEFGVSMRRLLPDAASRGLTAKKEDEGSILTYALPTSEFFEWKRATFFSKRSFLAFYDDMDPLSPQGALKSYLWRRNSAAENKCRKLEKDFSCLAPIPPKPQRDSLNEVLLLEEEEASPNPLENEMTERKKALHFKEIGLYRNVGVDSISLLNFHPYEDILVVCDGRSGITAWDSNRGTKELEFQNGNPRGSRFTSACWMNEAYNSLLVTGCDDGSVRVWGGLAFSAAEGRRQASKVSAFFAVPNLTPDTSKSGLILEWQQSSGLLNAAGNSDKIRSWDMNVEKCCHEMKTETKACITTLTTPWRDYLFEDARAMSGSYGAGPNLLVAGFSDGSIRLFDNRMGSPVMDASANSSRGRKQRMMHYKEHGSWVVTTAFTGYGNQYQIVSGSILGDVRVFDLRASSSLQTYYVQRSPMIAMTVHPHIPIVAAGSHAQFIKLYTLDGDTCQVIRHAEMNHGHRIGPVCSLAFHPRDRFLAAGGTDNVVHIFGPTT